MQVFLQYFLEGLRLNMKNFSYDSWYATQEANQLLPEYNYRELLVHKPV